MSFGISLSVQKRVSHYGVTGSRPCDSRYDLPVSNRYSLDTRDRPGLLFAMMRMFASEQSRIAFEGNLASTDLFRLAGGCHEETGTLKRATIAPQLDFVVLPLVPSLVPEIEKAVRSKVAFSAYKGIIHVQIESSGEIVFGAYDNFGRDCVFVNAIANTSILDDLVKARILKGYTPISK